MDLIIVVVVQLRRDMRSLIRICPQLGASGAVDIREYVPGGWLNT